MITNLNRMTGDRFPGLVRRFHDLRGRISGRAEVTPYLGSVGFTVPLAEVGAEMAEVVGQKSAFLGEAHRLLPGRVPEGFATTEPAYREFIGRSGLAERIAEVMAALDPSDTAATFSAAARITQMIESAPVPADLAKALEAGATPLAGDGTRFAVRSSALQEGGLEVSFAGQYRSLLNVPASGIVEAFRQVVASKYSPQAITYRLGRGLEDHEVAMCCCVLSMVDAASAGVLYSACRTEAGVRTLLQAVRGLGLSAVDGSAVPDSVLLDRKSGRLTGRTSGRQDALLACAGGEGTETLTVATGLQGVPILSDEQALEVARLAWRLEDHLGMPLDMEWAIDRKGRAFVLQVRPQPEHAGETWRAPAPRVAGARVLLEGGSRASGGVGFGKAHHVETDLDILRFPAGGVLVTSEANPRLAVLLPKAAALVADRGEVTGHLATVARELRVPALLATNAATVRLPGAAPVTVDADAGVVYDGRVDEALARVGGGKPPERQSPALERLASVTDLIVPLTLRDRLASGYSPRKCQTLHDMIRFCHQAAVEAMFALGDGALRQGTPVHRLVSTVPIDCRLIDLGGGLREGAGPGDVTIEDVASVPLRALWRGMTDPRVRWRMTRPVSLSGFLSAVVNYNYDQDVRVRAMGEPSYVFITSDYMNLNSRVGYHFSTVDAHVGEPVESNYASFRFVGGSTGVDQRSRRATLIQRILARHGFETDCKADLVNARLRHRPPEEMLQALVLVGLVTGFVNHLDMALTSDRLVTVFEEAFMAGRYGFKSEADDG
jgi:pyruvate,water dikinase